MIKPFLYIVFLFSFVSTAQNLVPNGSFEEYTICPEFRESNDGQFERCVGWWYPTSYSVGSPDYFNECNNSGTGLVGIPNNELGYQYAFDGQGMIGIAAISVFSQSQMYEVYELISCKLNQQLKPCYQYKFSCYVNLAEASTYGIDGLGFACTSDSLVMNSFDDVFSNTPDWFSSQQIIDTTNWVKLEATFIASGGECFLTFGSFFPKEATNWLQSNTGSTISFDAAYYYVDSVSLIEVQEIENCIPELPNVFTPNGDQTNDVYSIENLNISELIVVNRWGNIITVLTDKQPFWDGTFEGKPCSEGNYFYRAKFGNTYLTGFIELIR